MAGLTLGILGGIAALAVIATAELLVLGNLARLGAWLVAPIAESRVLFWIGAALWFCIAALVFGFMCVLAISAFLGAIGTRPSRPSARAPARRSGRARGPPPREGATMIVTGARIPARELRVGDYIETAGVATTVTQQADGVIRVRITLVELLFDPDQLVEISTSRLTGGSQGAHEVRPPPLEEAWTSATKSSASRTTATSCST